MDPITEIESTQDWLDQVKTSSGKVLVEFFATWCPHCKEEQPILESMQADLKQHGIALYQVDVDKVPEATEEMRIIGTPTFVLFEDGLPVVQQPGEMNAEQLTEFCGIE